MSWTTPAAGHAPEYVAITAGRTASVWRLEGSADQLQVHQQTAHNIPDAYIHARPFALHVWGSDHAEDAGTTSQASKAGDLEHGANICQIEWNASGTWLAVATDDGRLSLWRQNLLGSWKLVSTTEAVIPGSCIMVD